MNPGDIMLVRGRLGAAFTGQLTVPSSGLPAAPIRILSEASVSPTSSVTGATACFSLTDKSDVHIANFWNLENTKPSTDQAIIFVGGASKDMRINSCRSTLNRNAGATVAGVADFTDPPNGDFSYKAGSDFAAGGLGGADIGTNRAYGY